MQAALTHSLIFAIRLYRGLKFLIPAISCCRFHPTCSAYAIDALSLHGPLKGVKLLLGRLARCHPAHAGGFDPVI